MSSEKMINTLFAPAGANSARLFDRLSPRPKPGTESFVRLYDDIGQTVPVMTSVAVPGVTVNVPSVFCVNVAAGTVICPASVVKTPVAAL